MTRGPNDEIYRRYHRIRTAIRSNDLFGELLPASSGVQTRAVAAERLGTRHQDQPQRHYGFLSWCVLLSNM